MIWAYPSPGACMSAMISTELPSRQRSLVLGAAVSCAASAAILGGAMAQSGAPTGWWWLHWIAKPLATVLVLALACFAAAPISRRYQAWVAAGIVCSLIGDVLLMLPQNLFVAGLVAFLCGHACFIAAFLNDSGLAVRPSAWLACLLVGGANLYLLWPSIPPALHVPVAVYGLLLSSMGGLAVARAWFHAAMADRLALPARRAALGGVLFMLSDSLLAWDRFHAALPLATLWILGSYYAALWFIARSVMGGETTKTASAMS